MFDHLKTYYGQPDICTRLSKPHMQVNEQIQWTTKVWDRFEELFIFFSVCLNVKKKICDPISI